MMHEKRQNAKKALKISKKECQKLKEELESLKNTQQETEELLENAECEIHQQ